jgi:hypothetical protein
MHVRSEIALRVSINGLNASEELVYLVCLVDKKRERAIGYRKERSVWSTGSIWSIWSLWSIGLKEQAIGYGR